MEPTRSAKKTVRCRRSAPDVPVSSWPQLPQRVALLGFRNWHSGQGTPSEVPHSAQNFVDGAFSVPQLGQRTTSESSVWVPETSPKADALSTGGTLSPCRRPLVTMSRPGARTRCRPDRDGLRVTVRRPTFTEMTRQSALDEREKVGVELLLVGDHEAMRRARIDLQLGVLDDLRGEQRRVGDRHDLVVVAVEDQGRNVEPLQILGQIGLRERLDAVVGAFEPASCSSARTRREPPGRRSSPRGSRRRRGRSDPCRTANGRRRRRPGSRRTPRSAAHQDSLRLQHQGRDRADEHRFCDAIGSVTADIARHLAAAGRMTDEDDVSQVERSISSARSSAYCSRSFPFQGWLERPWPRRSCATPR